VTALEDIPGVLGPTGRPVPVFPEPEPLLTHGPARIAAVCNQKGGVGKTTTTINLGAALAEHGRRVLLVDFDPQGALSVGLGIQPHELDATIYNLLLQRGITASDVVIKTSVDNMDLLPSNIDLSGAEVQLVHEVGREFVLGRVLQPLIPDYDIVLIDCQPSLGLLTVNARRWPSTGCWPPCTTRGRCIPGKSWPTSYRDSVTRSFTRSSAGQ
jgi:chromosome partitioning protein